MEFLDYLPARIVHLSVNCPFLQVSRVYLCISVMLAIGRYCEAPGR